MEATKKPNLKRKAREILKDVLPTRIEGKLHHELQEAQQAAKKAKTFEMQRLVKKLKGLRKISSDSVDVRENEAQLALLKEVDVRSIANTAFKTKLLKDKSLRENGVMKEAIDKEIQSATVTLAAPLTPLGKVQSRLLSSKVLASQITASLSSLKAIIDPEHTAKDKKPRITSAEPFESSAFKRTAGDKERLGRDIETSEDEDDDGNEDVGDGWESGFVDEEYGSRLDLDGSEEEASGSEAGEEANKGSGNVSDDEDETKKAKVASKPAKASKAEASASKLAQSTFLPSLQAAYISGSDDDSDIDDEAQIAEPRKNRRGQRARRAIWEKKFGKNANHRKAEAKVIAETQAKRPQRMLFSANNKGPRGPLLSGSNLQISDGSRRTFGQKAPPETLSGLPVKPTSAAKSLHPSWEAKKRLKEKEKDAIVPSQGKKIVF